MHKNGLSLLAMSIILVGCSSSSETFDCPAGKGLGCKSITEVNAIVSQEEETSKKDALEKSAPAVAQKPGKEVSYSAKDSSVPGSVRRAQDEHRRVWMAPFEDEEGNFHEASVIHTLVKPGAWQMSDLSKERA